MYPLIYYPILAAVAIGFVCRVLATEQVHAADAEIASAGIPVPAGSSAVDLRMEKQPSAAGKQADSALVASTRVPLEVDYEDATPPRGLARRTLRYRKPRVKTSNSRRRQLMRKIGMAVLAIVGAAMIVKAAYSRRQNKLRAHAFSYIYGRAGVAERAALGLEEQRREVRELLGRVRVAQRAAVSTDERQELTETRQALEKFDALLAMQARASQRELADFVTAIGILHPQVRHLPRSLWGTNAALQAFEAGRLDEGRRFWNRLHPHEEAVRSSALPGVVSLEQEIEEARRRDLPTLPSLYQQMEEARGRQVTSTLDEQITALNRQVPNFVGVDPDYAEQHLLHFTPSRSEPGYVRMAADVMRQAMQVKTGT